MAIGDTPNQNLFGTNYNSEEEEEKKARLAAQGARMGAGGVPASAFGQAPAVNPFSIEAAGQVNPMMEQQSIPTESVSNPITNNPFLSTSETPIVAQPPVKNALLEMLERADAREAQGLPRQDAPGIIDAPSEALALGATPSVNLPAETPSVGAQEQVQAIPQGAPGSAQANFATRMETGEALSPQEIQDAQAFAASMGTTFDPATGYSREPFKNAQQAQGQVPTAPMPGQSLSQFMRYEDAPEQRTEQFVDEQGRMRSRPTQEALQLQAQGAVPQPPAAALSSFEQASLERQQRIGGTGSYEGDSQAMQDRLAARPDFNKAVSDRDRRAARGDGISMADQTDMAKANARGASPREVARGNQVANALGVDLKTGQPPEATGAFKPSDILARERFEYDKQQDLIDDDTSDNATTRKIATIKQANPDISDADAAAIASGSVRVVTNDLTGVTQLLNIATGESRQIESQAAPDVNFDVAVPEQTLFSRAGDFTGFVEATKRKAQGITGQMGLDVATEESLGAAQDFETAQNELVRAFRESSRYAASEAAALKKELNISLSPFEDPKSAEAKLRSIDKSLARRYENEVATFKDTTFPAPERQDSRMRAKAIAEFRANLGVPPEGQGSTSSTQGKVPQGVDPKDWEFMSPEQRNLFN